MLVQLQIDGEVYESRRKYISTARPWLDKIIKGTIRYFTQGLNDCIIW